MSRWRAFVLSVLLLVSDVFTIILVATETGSGLVTMVWLGLLNILLLGVFRAYDAGASRGLSTRSAIVLLAFCEAFFLTVLARGPIPLALFAVPFLSLLLREGLLAAASRIGTKTLRVDRDGAGARHLRGLLSRRSATGLILVNDGDAELRLAQGDVPREFGGALRSFEDPKTGRTFRAREGPLEGGSATLKRHIDLLFSLILLVLLLPLMAALFLLSRWRDGKPTVYQQSRWTEGQRPFGIIKIRTMHLEAEEGGAPQWPVENDPRSTPLGMVLRRFWLDEIPQLWNIIRGDLSFVGPRPERPEFAQVFLQEIATYTERYKARAGLTGWAQALGYIGNTSLRKRAFCDRLYVENWSPCLDVMILLATVLQVFRRTKRKQFDYVPGRDRHIP